MVRERKEWQLDHHDDNMTSEMMWLDLERFERLAAGERVALLCERNVVGGVFFVMYF